MLETTFARSRALGSAGPVALLLALVVGCKPAPLDGKPCPCATSAGYTCCDASMMCVLDATQCPQAACASHQLNNLAITQNGGPHPQPDGGPDGIQFGQGTEIWFAYPYQGQDQTPPTIDLGAPKNGVHVTATVTSSGVPGEYAGVGLSFLGNDCVDGSQLNGVQFQLEGDLAGHSLSLGVVAIDDLSHEFDPRGLCTLGRTNCYGPTYSIDASANPIKVAFQSLRLGNPDDGLDTTHIAKVQWQLGTPTDTTADFTISNVQFY